jgi:hypothetical protein
VSRHLGIFGAEDPFEIDVFDVPPGGHGAYDGDAIVVGDLVGRCRPLFGRL